MVARWSAHLRTDPRGRAVGVDVARCLALVGMMSTHLLDSTGADGQVAWHQSLAGGRSSALFAVLAGVSLSLMTGGTTPRAGLGRVADSAALATRALLITALGVWLAGLDTHVAVILPYYGLLFLAGLAFTGLRAGALAALAGAWALAAPVVSHLLRSTLEVGGPSVPTVGGQSWPDALMDLSLTGYYPVLPWITYLLAGMALGRLDLRRVRVAGGAAVAGGVLAAVAWALSRAALARPDAQAALLGSLGGRRWVDGEHRLALGLHGTTPTDSWWWLMVAAPHSGTPLDLAHTAGTALLVLGLALLGARIAGRVWALVFGAGAMSLTLYTLHIVMLTPRVWPQDRPEDFATHLVVVLGAGALFAAARLRGPLEVLVRLASSLPARALLASAPAGGGTGCPGRAPERRS